MMTLDEAIRWAREYPNPTIMRWEVARVLASVGRNAERQDNADWLGPKDEHAVGEAETPKDRSKPNRQSEGA